MQRLPSLSRPFQPSHISRRHLVWFGIKVLENSSIQSCLQIPNLCGMMKASTRWIPTSRSRSGVVRFEIGQHLGTGRTEQLSMDHPAHDRQVLASTISNALFSFFHEQSHPEHGMGRGNDSTNVAVGYFYVPCFLGDARPNGICVNHEASLLSSSSSGH
jgi:hypothetical protein